MSPVPSHRIVGPSSKAGSSTVVRRGTTTRELTEYEACECGGMKPVGGPHAPRMSPSGLVDCVGNPILAMPRVLP